MKTVLLITAVFDLPPTVRIFISFRWESFFFTVRIFLFYSANIFTVVRRFLLLWEFFYCGENFSFVVRIFVCCEHSFFFVIILFLLQEFFSYKNFSPENSSLHCKYFSHQSKNFWQTMKERSGRLCTWA